MMILNKATKERIIESHLRHYHTYKVGMKNCQKQLDYISPTLVTGYGTDGMNSVFYIANNTEKVGLDRIESKRAIDLKEEIERFKLITESIDNAFEELKEQEQFFVRLRYFECLQIYEVKTKMGYAEERAIYRIRRHVLDKLLISLNNLLSLK
jgi:DNA-directed RNA polymerase specialized sigma subunit